MMISLMLTMMMNMIIFDDDGNAGDNGDDDDGDDGDDDAGLQSRN